MSEIPRFREDREIAENQPDRIKLTARVKIQIEILLALGFKSHEEEKTDLERNKARDWTAEHRGEISEIMDSGEYAPQIRQLVEQEKFVEAAKLIVEILELSR